MSLSTTFHSIGIAGMACFDKAPTEKKNAFSRIIDTATLKDVRKPTDKESLQWAILYETFIDNQMEHLEYSECLFVLRQLARDLARYKRYVMFADRCMSADSETKFTATTAARKALGQLKSYVKFNSETE